MLGLIIGADSMESKKEDKNNIDAAEKIRKTKKWVTFLSIVVGGGLFFTQISQFAMAVIGIVVLFFIIDYEIWNFCLNSIVSSETSEVWINAAERYSKSKKKDKSKKIEIKLFVSFFLIVVLGFFVSSSTLFCSIAILCIIAYMLCLYLESSMDNLLVRVPHIAGKEE